MNQLLLCLNGSQISPTTPPLLKADQWESTWGMCVSMCVCELCVHMPVFYQGRELGVC